MEYAQNVLLRDKTKARVHFLQDELLSLAKHGGACLFSGGRGILFNDERLIRLDALANFGCLQASYVDVSSVF